MARLDKLLVQAAVVGVLLVIAPTANAWVRFTPRDVIETENEPGIVAIGFATVDVPSTEVAWTCDQPTAEVVVGTTFWHAPTGTWRRNLALDLAPPTAPATASCELRDGTTTITRIVIEFTSAGVRATFPAATIPAVE